MAQTAAALTASPAEELVRRAALPYNASTIAAMRELIENPVEVSEATSSRLQEGLRSAKLADQYLRSVTEGPSPHSAQFTTAGSYFSVDEGEIRSFEDLHVKIDRLMKKNPGLDLVWRGHQNADWGLQSKLFRVLSSQSHGTTVASYPTEEQMVEAERRILREAREEWRIDDMSAIEIFARLQHYGAPTRLIDVSRNPLIATWFAVEDGGSEDRDGRLFAIATGPVPKDRSTLKQLSRVSTSELMLDGEPVWHSYVDIAARRTSGWGTGMNRLVWIPGVYEERIAAQNAGFVLDGVPILSTEAMPSFARHEGTSEWTSSDLLAAGSIYVHTQRTTRMASPRAPNFAPTFTFRISANLKADIREKLRSRYSYSRGTIYPDISGLAMHLNQILSATAQIRT
jgi:hypothetical protein